MSQKPFNKKIIIIQNISDIVYDTEIYEHYRINWHRHYIYYDMTTQNIYSPQWNKCKSQRLVHFSQTKLVPEITVSVRIDRVLAASLVLLFISLRIRQRHLLHHRKSGNFTIMTIWSTLCGRWIFLFATEIDILLAGPEMSLVKSHTLSRTISLKPGTCV